MKSDNKPTIAGCSNAEALELIAKHVDRASDSADAGPVDHLLHLADELEARGLPPCESALLDYFRANAWACLYHRKLKDRAALWDFEQPELRQQVFLLRRAQNGPGFAELDPIRRCQILTNLANQLDTLGRFVDAHASWSAAVKIDPNFWMARANRGRGLMHYAAALYDHEHEAIFALHAHRDLTDAVQAISTHPHLGDSRLATTFSRAAWHIARHYDIEAIGNRHRKQNQDLPAEPVEREYRHWCLENVLFLNPMNDVEKSPFAAHDGMRLPDFITAAGEPPIVVGMFNELKQGFVSVRWLLWEGMLATEPHISDRRVLLYNTLDYPAYGLAIEKVKIAFRIAYSILDKIAYFLNHYLMLGIPEKRVAFRTMWREKESGPVRARFVSSENWAFRGLFWLSKDLFEEGMRDSTEPEARNLAELRNHLEHKYVKVHEILLPAPPSDDPFYDTLAYPIERSDMARRTLRLVQLVRSALIYLSLGMHREERERAKGKDGLIATMPLEPWQDEWNIR